MIDIALAAIESAKDSKSTTPETAKAISTQSVGVKKHRIQWSREINRFLDDYEEFTIMDLQKDLSEKRGISAAMTIQGRNVINNTLNRFEKRGRIQKINPGVYHVIKESLPT